MRIGGLVLIAGLLVGCGARTLAVSLEDENDGGLPDGAGPGSGGSDSGVTIPIEPTGCFDDAGVLVLPEDSARGQLSLSDPDDGLRGNGYLFDVYEFAGPAGTRVTLEATIASFDTYFYLLDADCNELAQDDDGGNGLLSRLEYTLPEDGTYMLVVTSYANEVTGSYTVALTAVTTPEVELNCADGRDDDVDGYVDCEDDDCARSSVCLPRFESNCSNGADDDSDGATDCEDPDCAGIPPCNIVPLACDWSSGVLPLPESSVEGTLSSSDPSDGPQGWGYYFDAYQVTIPAGQQVTFETVEGSFDTILHLMDGTCSQVTSDDDGGAGLLSRITYTATASQTYTIVVTSYRSGTTGSYVLSISAAVVPSTEIDCGDYVDNDRDGRIDCEDPDCVNADECIVEPPHLCIEFTEAFLPGMEPVSVTGSLDSGDPLDGPRGSSYYYEQYLVLMEPGFEATFETTNASFDTYLYLLDERCMEVDRDDDGGVGLHSRITYEVDYPAEYTLVVTSYGSYATGTYTLLVGSEPVVASEVDCDDGVDDDDDGLVDCDDPDCANSPICTPLPPRSCYPDADQTSLAQGYAEGSLETSDLDSGGPRGYGYYFDSYEIWLDAGDTVVLEVLEGSFDTFLYLRSPNCIQLTYNDDANGLLSLITFTAPAAGTYTAVLTSYNLGETGPYVLTARREPGASTETNCTDGEDDDRDGWVDCEDPDCEGFPECEPPPEHCFGIWQELIGPGEIVDGELGPGDPTGGPRGTEYYFDALELFAGRGMDLWIETIEGDFDTYLYLLNEYCEVVAYNDDGGLDLLSQMEYFVPDDGRYTIVVTSWGYYDTGYYVLAVF